MDRGAGESLRSPPLRHPGLVPGSTGRPAATHATRRLPCVYIMASAYNGSLYVGVTSNLIARCTQHRDGTFGGHTSKYAIHRLVYFEVFDDMATAIAREKQQKRYRRDWKRNLIERDNPAWNDLAVGLGLEPLIVSPSGPVDPGTSPG